MVCAGQSKGLSNRRDVGFPVFIANQSPSLVSNDAGDLVESEDGGYNVWGHLALPGRDAEVVFTSNIESRRKSG